VIGSFSCRNTSISPGRGSRELREINLITIPTAESITLSESDKIVNSKTVNISKLFEVLAYLFAWI
jgi:hypothetical protein